MSDLNFWVILVMPEYVYCSQSEIYGQHWAAIKSCLKSLISPQLFTTGSTLPGKQLNEQKTCLAVLSSVSVNWISMIKRTGNDPRNFFLRLFLFEPSRRPAMIKRSSASDSSSSSHRRRTLVPNLDTSAIATKKNWVRVDSLFVFKVSQEGGRICSNEQLH